MTIELPFGNNQRLGRLAQSTASASESQIRVADLSRSIQNNVPKLAETLARTRAEWEQRQEAVIQYEATWDTAQRLRGSGDMTLIDTLLTEQQLTQARLQLVQAKRDYASAVARFRRETGTLVDFTEWSRAQPNLARHRGRPVGKERTCQRVCFARPHSTRCPRPSSSTCSCA